MKPLVGIIVGSDSDLPLIKETTSILEKLEVPFEITIGSAHRTPDFVAEYVNTASARGIKVLIAAAGLSAHLPGVVASKTLLPVIGIPVDGGPLNGVDALYSIVQMPGGIPVASMAIGKSGARNAAVFATQILALADEKLAEKLKVYRQEMSESVKEKAKRLSEMGIEKYIDEKE
ncbi:5-(carboxyamino)imidazole ribonucleotide mutase [Candidatus Poribacteria bacterium]|nr:5-(carboxyamino)imidazole ribonucleotide mutase [Candidatus Poribacteria bacterium]